EGHLDVGADAETRQSLAPAAAHPSPLARAALRRQTPEVGAECVNSACSDLCGGCAAMRIPTANLGKVSFVEAETVADGLGPRMNLDNCGGCHSQPGFGGTSPSQNPQIALAKFNRVNRSGTF